MCSKKRLLRYLVNALSLLTILSLPVYSEVPKQNNYHQTNTSAGALSVTNTGSSNGVYVETGMDMLTDPLGGTGGGPISGSLQVRVVYGGTTDPVAGAFVMAGAMAGHPFPGNWGFTAENGEITFTHPDLQGPISVTAGAAGYQYFTIVSVDANDLVISLKPILASGQAYEVGDYVSGIDVDNGPINYGDGWVDMAFVTQGLTLEDFLYFDWQSLCGPMETMELIGSEVEIPSNIFIPQQWELFIELNKDHYYLYLPEGDYTICALAGRIGTSDLLDLLNSGADMAEILPLFSWREIDIIDVTVNGNTNNADLFVDPDLDLTVTMNLDNIPDGSATWCFSVGDLDALHGLGRLILLGFTSFDCEAGTGPCSGTVDLATVAATGEFSGIGYFPVAAVSLNESEDQLVIMERESHSRTYSTNLASFFNLLSLNFSSGLFSWNEVENPGAGSPDVDIQIARIKNSENEQVYWEFMIPGDVLSMLAPILPPQAPPGPSIGASYLWEHLAVGLAYNPPAFNFNNFAFSDIAAHSSHLAIDNIVITFEYNVDVCEGEFAPADGDVDGSDLAVFAVDFGRTDCDSGSPCEGDFDGDGDVNGSDLAVFAADFGRTNCPQR